MIRATLDVNVLVSGLPAERGVPAELLARWADREYLLVLSENILEGLLRAWQKPYYQRRYAGWRAEESMRILRRFASIVEPAIGIHGIADDEEDDLVLATAVAGAVQYLVTGDKPLQALGSYRGITILPPRAFLDILEIEPREPR